MDETQKITALKQVPLFAGLKDKVLADLSSVSNFADLPPKRKLCQQGGDPVTVYVLLHGVVCVYRRLPDLRRRAEDEYRAIPICFLQEYCTIGEIEPILGSIYISSAITVTPAKVLCISAKDFIRLGPSLGLNLTKAVGDKLLSTIKFIEKTSLSTKKQTMLELIEIFATKMNLEPDTAGFVHIDSMLKPSRVGKLCGSGKAHRKNVFSDLANRNILIYDDPQDEEGPYRVNLEAIRSLSKRSEEESL